MVSSESDLLSSKKKKKRNRNFLMKKLNLEKDLKVNVIGAVIFEYGNFILVYIVH